jgi:hypothetical protein
MTDEELRAIVRATIARTLRQGAPAPAVAAPCAGHPSHARFLLARDTDGDAPCLVEPARHCTHCGYCQSYGH